MMIWLQKSALIQKRTSEFSFGYSDAQYLVLLVLNFAGSILSIGGTRDTHWLVWGAQKRNEAWKPWVESILLNVSVEDADDRQFVTPK